MCHLRVLATLVGGFPAFFGFTGLAIALLRDDFLSPNALDRVKGFP